MNTSQTQLKRPLRRRIARSIANLSPRVSTVAEYATFLAAHNDVFSHFRAGDPTLVERLRTQGFAVIPGYLDQPTCKAWIAEIDRLFVEYEAHVRRFSDIRLYGVEQVSATFDRFSVDPQLQALSDQVMGARTANAFTLAGILRAEPGKKLGSGEHWHRDHYFRQFKALLYLTDVGPDNGPFELIPGSHHFAEQLRNMDAAGMKFREIGPFSDEQISKITDGDPSRIHAVTAPAGSLIVVDTGCIHRGRPATQGIRYALTNYYLERDQTDESAIERFKPIRPERVRELCESAEHWASDSFVNKIKRKTKTFSFMLRNNPESALNTVALRVEHRTGLPMYALSIKRMATLLFEIAKTRPVDSSLVEYGNYYLDPSVIPPSPVVVSLGIGRDIRFDRAVFDRHPDARVVMVDPTASTKTYLSAQQLPAGASFHNVAVAREDGFLTVYPDGLDRTDGAESVSSTNAHGFHREGFKVPCKRLTTILQEEGLGKVDILKADIEGMAIDVVETALDAGLLPGQIACEFERPISFGDTATYLRRLDGLFRRLRRLDYEIFRTRPFDKGLQIEVVAVRRP